MQHLNKSCIGLLLLTAACAGSAPPLPTDTTSNNRQATIKSSDFSSGDLAKNCSNIKSELNTNAAAIGNNNSVIESNRGKNQVAGYLGGMFLVPLAATESNTQEKEKIAQLQNRQDVLRKLAAFKKCNLPN